MKNEYSQIKIYAKRLINEYHYPSEVIQKEISYAFGKARYRLDIVVMKREKPYIVVEIKTNLRRVSKRDMDQLLDYARATDAEFVVISDGYIDWCYKRVLDAYTTHLDQIADIPPYNKTLEDIGKHSNSELVKVGYHHLQRLIMHSIDLIYENQGFSKDQTAKEILKLLLLKVYDEETEAGSFRTYYGDTPDDIKSRIFKLHAQAVKAYPIILDDPPNLNPELLREIVYKLQKYSLKDSGHDIIGSKFPFEEVYGRNQFQFSTPRSLIKLILDLLDLKKGYTFIDPACGVGNLLSEAAKRGCKVIGIDINRNIAQYAKGSLALSGFSGNVLIQDSLKSSEEFNYSIREHIPKDGFDYAAIVPPFGSRITDTRLNNFVLGKTRKSQSIEVLFLERTLELLTPGGKLGVVIPEGLLSSASSQVVREFILQNSIVKAIISLPPTVFSPYSSVKTSLLLLEYAPKRGTTQEDKVFVAILENLEHFESVITAFRDFLKKKTIPHKENLFITNISSANHIDAGYLKGLRSISHWANRYQHIELQEVTDITTGNRLDRIGKEDPEGNSWYVRARNVSDLILDLNETDRVEITENVSRWLVEPGDILMTRAGTVGRVALVQDISAQIVAGSNVVKISIRDKNRIPPEFLLAFLKSKQGRQQIEMYAGGSAIRAISVSGLKKIKIPVLPKERQQKVISKVREIINTKDEINSALEELRKKEEKLIHELDDLILEEAD